MNAALSGNAWFFLIGVSQLSEEVNDIKHLVHAQNKAA